MADDILDRMNKIGKKLHNGSAKEKDVTEFHLLFCKQQIRMLGVDSTKALSELDKSTLIAALDSMATIMWPEQWKHDRSVVEIKVDSHDVQEEEG